jgi:hypothetical protein
MNPHERQIIDDLFDKLREVEQQSDPREPIAEAHIRSRVQQQPGVPYYMAQTILMQEQALQTAQARIAELEDEVRAGSGFLNRSDRWSFCLTAARMAAEQERR